MFGCEGAEHYEIIIITITQRALLELGEMFLYIFLFLRAPPLFFLFFYWKVFTVHTVRSNMTQIHFTNVILRIFQNMVKKFVSINSVVRLSRSPDNTPLVRLKNILVPNHVVVYLSRDGSATKTNS